jgi:hypothetical protein
MDKTEIPEGLQVSMEGNEVIIRKGRAGSAAIWTLFSAGAAYFNVWIRHENPRRGMSPMDWFLNCIELVPIAGMVYVGLCLVLDKTEVVISTNRVRTRSRPLPLWGDRDVPARDIRRVFTKEVKGADAKMYAVMYEDPARKKRELVRVWKKKEEAEFIEASIRHILGLEPAEVVGAAKTTA